MEPRKKIASPASGHWKAFSLILGLGLVLLAYGGLSTSEPEARPLPFDPLSPEEADFAVETALADPVLALSLDRYETIGAALNTDKERMKSGDPTRMADVWFYEYSTDRTVWALVDLTQEEVAKRDATLLYQPPMTTDEMDRAGAMALEDPGLQDHLKTKEFQEVGTSARLWTGTAAGACPVNRCALVALELDGEFQHDLFVRVNLSLDSVEKVLEARELGMDHSGEVHA